MDSGMKYLSSYLVRLFLALTAIFAINLQLSYCKASGYATAQELVAAVTERALAVNTLSCDVVQEKHLAMLARPVVFTGRMSVKRPDKLRWEFVKPIPSVFIINGSRILRCSPDMAPAEFDIASNPVMKQAAVQMLAWVGGDFKSLAGMFRISLSSEGTGLVLVPKEMQMSAGITRITVMFDPATLRPATVRIDEQAGDWTRIVLTNYRINRVMDRGLFESCHLFTQGLYLTS